MSIFSQKTQMPDANTALKGREEALLPAKEHYIHGRPILPPFPQGMEQILFGLGCFWGAERKFWPLPGVHTTAVGYSAGFTPNASYEEVCTGKTGHNEVVLVVFAPEQIALEALLAIFWEAHNPTQGMRQGNDQGTQYRSGIYVYSQAHKAMAEASRDAYQSALVAAGFGSITTEIVAASEFYYAEDYHQQYLAKNPNGYCGLGGTGVSCVV